MTLVSDTSQLLGQIITAIGPANDNFAALRTRALDALSTLGLPGAKTEEYRFTPVVRALEKQFKTWPSGAAASAPIDVATYLIPGAKTFVVVTVNGEWRSDLSMLEDAPFNVSGLHQDRTGITGTQLDFNSDAFAAMNTALWNGGVLIDIPANRVVDKPILLLNFIDARTAPVAIHNRLTVRVSEAATVSLTEKTIYLGDHPSFSTTGEEVLVEKRGHFDYTRVQNERQALQVTLTNIRQLDGSQVNTFTLTTDGKLVRNNLTIAIDGEQCESHFHGLYLVKGETLVDNHTVVDHRKPNSFSNELYKGVLDDSSRGVFNGKIYVRPDAQKTNAFQSNRNILLTDKAQINTKPQLEIWADDVKCSHGCTTGQLDEEAMFYLQSRGISKELARALLLSAFAGETLELIANPSLKEHLQGIVALRLNDATS